MTKVNTLKMNLSENQQSVTAEKPTQTPDMIKIIQDNNVPKTTVATYLPVQLLINEFVSARRNRDIKKVQNAL